MTSCPTATDTDTGAAPTIASSSFAHGARRSRRRGACATFCRGVPLGSRDGVDTATGDRVDVGASDAPSPTGRVWHPATTMVAHAAMTALRITAGRTAGASGWFRSIALGGVRRPGQDQDVAAVVLRDEAFPLDRELRVAEPPQIRLSVGV